MTSKEAARQRLQLRRARIRFRQESVREESIAHDRDLMRGYWAMGGMFIAFEVLVFLGVIGVI